MKQGLMMALVALASTAISCTGTLWSHDTVVPDSTLNTRYYSTAVVSVGTDNRPAILAQRSVSVEQPNGVYGQPDVYRQELVLVRTDDRGQLTQSVVLVPKSQPIYSQMHLQPTSDGGFIALYLADDPLNWQLVRISASGSVVWSRLFNPFPAGPRIYSLLVNQLGDLFAAGYYYQNAGGPVACIARLTPQGDVLWAKSYPDLPGSGSYGYTLTLTPEGGCVLSGRLLGFDGSSSQNSFLLKTNADGGLIWSKTYLMPGITAHVPVVDGYLLTGPMNTATGSALYVSKTFQDGTPQWYRDNLLTGFYNSPVYLFAENDQYTVLGNGSTPLPTPGNGFLWAQFDSSGTPLGRVVTTAFSGPELNESGRFQNVVKWTGNGYLTVSRQQTESEGIKLALVGYDGQPKWVSVVVKSDQPR